MPLLKVVPYGPFYFLGEAVLTVLVQKLPSLTKVTLPILSTTSHTPPLLFLLHFISLFAMTSNVQGYFHFKAFAPNAGLFVFWIST